MQYRALGMTGLMVSEIGFGGEWIKGDDVEGTKALLARCDEAGVNIVDCWMSDPAVRSALGAGLEGMRDRWIIQGHVGATWQDGQYVRTRDMDEVRPAFEDLLERLKTDHIELGMIHYVDDVEEYRAIMAGSPFIAYMRELKEAGTIGHIGLSTHNPDVALLAAQSGEIEAIMFSVNPAFDLMPATDDLEVLFGEYDEGLSGMEPVRAELYATCEREGVGITVMKGYAGGRLLDAATSPFGVTLTPLQCIHYALTRPAVASIIVGAATPEHVNDAVAYETAGAQEKDYATVLAGAPKHAYFGQCTYCGHCAPCASEIDIAMVNKFYDLAVQQSEVPASVKAHYEALDHTADECIDCQECEPRCPFGVKIAERMREAEALFA